MGMYQHPRVFGPLDLEIVDQVYDAAWAQIEAREPFRDRDGDDERRQALRKLIMDSTGTERIDFDVLLERVLTTIPEEWTMFERPTC
jgi:hypothetical protein